MTEMSIDVDTTKPRTEVATVIPHNHNGTMRDRSSTATPPKGEKVDLRSTEP